MRIVAKAAFLGLAIQLFVFLSFLSIRFLYEITGYAEALSSITFLIVLLTLCMVILHPLSKLFDRIRPKFSGAIVFLYALIFLITLAIASLNVIDSFFIFLFFLVALIFSIPITMLSELFFGSVFKNEPLDYATAEKELKDNNVDSNLWAQAFVKAKGNEDIRKVIYIKMRATQLQNAGGAKR